MIIKKLTESERQLKNALNLRVLSLYREKENLKKKELELLERIEHLEKQIDKIGGPGLDIEERLKK